MNRKSRREHLESLKRETRTMVFYEAPHKLRSTLADMIEYFGGERRVSLSRELTKLHEETVRTTLAEAAALYACLLYTSPFARECGYLTVHSVLHLLGYDHERGDEERALMRRREEAALALVGLERQGD